MDRCYAVNGPGYEVVKILLQKSLGGLVLWILGMLHWAEESSFIISRTLLFSRSKVRENKAISCAFNFSAGQVHENKRRAEVKGIKFFGCIFLRVHLPFCQTSGSG